MTRNQEKTVNIGYETQRPEMVVMKKRAGLVVKPFG